MLPHKAALVLPKECGIAAPCFHLLPCGRITTWRAGWGFDRYLAGSGISCGRTGQMWRAVFERQDEEERILFQIKALLSLSLFLPLLYKSKSQYQRRLLSVYGYIDWQSDATAGSGYPIHQWNVRENNTGRSSHIPEDNWSWNSSTETLQRMVQAADNLFRCSGLFRTIKQIFQIKL